MITDPDVIVGNKEDEIQVDFNRMTQRDAADGSKFEVGGRMYFEAHCFATGYVSFTTNGFLDKEGYVEPQKSAAVIAVSKLTWLWWVLGAAALLAISICWCCTRNKKTVDTTKPHEANVPN